MSQQPTRLDPRTIADPYPRYHQLRAEDPVRWNKGVNAWILTRYSDVSAALRYDRLSAERITALTGLIGESGGESARQFERTFLKMMLFSDPPDHTRLRSLANKAFTPRVVEQIRSHIQGIVKGLLDGVQPDGDREPGKIDVITDLAYPLPAIVIAEMLGAEPKDRDQFKKWSDDLAAFLGNIRIVSETYESAMKSVAELIDYLRELVAQRRKEPKDDLISALVMAEDQGDSFTQEELFSMCVLLIFAGHETTTNLISNGILAPLNNPSELAKLRQNPSLIVPAIEEIIRYDGPVQTTTRTALEPLEIGGKQIAKGDRISLTLGAANRDPAQFPDPDRMDITRGENRHVGFGFGIHFCLGAALARMESQLAIGAMVERMPELRLESADLVWRDNPILRGVNSLPVAF